MKLNEPLQNSGKAVLVAPGEVDINLGCTGVVPEIIRYREHFCNLSFLGGKRRWTLWLAELSKASGSVLPAPQGFPFPADCGNGRRAHGGGR